MHQKNLNDILDEPAMKNVLGEDVSNYFTALLADPRGWNIRNNKSLGPFGDRAADNGPARGELVTAATQLSASVGCAAACRAFAVPHASFYRARTPRPELEPGSPRPKPARLSEAERQAVLDHLHSVRFVDQAPHQVHAALLDEGIYLCSPRTMYRLLDEHGEARERRDQLRHPVYQKPELLATRPNQVWSWDITKLRGPVKWTFEHL